MANVRAVSPSTEDIVTGRLRCFSDWLQVANHLHFDGEADITTTPYDILVDEHLLAQYTTLYNRPGTQAGCAVAFLVLNHFFTRIALTSAVLPPFTLHQPYARSSPTPATTPSPLPADAWSRATNASVLNATTNGYWKANAPKFQMA